MHLLGPDHHSSENIRRAERSVVAGDVLLISFLLMNTVPSGICLGLLWRRAAVVGLRSGPF